MQDPVQTDSTELLQTLIRNACVNDGDVASGQKGAERRRARGVLRRLRPVVRALQLPESAPPVPKRANR